MNALPQRKLGTHGPVVSVLGFGCMGLNYGYATVLNKPDAIPDGHLLRGVDHFLDLSEQRKHLATYYSNTGRPSIAHWAPLLSLVGQDRLELKP